MDVISIIIVVITLSCIIIQSIFLYKLNKEKRKLLNLDIVALESPNAKTSGEALSKLLCGYMINLVLTNYSSELKEDEVDDRFNKHISSEKNRKFVINLHENPSLESIFPIEK